MCAPPRSIFQHLHTDFSFPTGKSTPETATYWEALVLLIRLLFSSSLFFFVSSDLINSEGTDCGGDNLDIDDRAQVSKRHSRYNTVLTQAATYLDNVAQHGYQQESLQLVRVSSILKCILLTSSEGIFPWWLQPAWFCTVTTHPFSTPARTPRIGSNTLTHLYVDQYKPSNTF